jgi:poly-gamma-glutamate capsule biosynthesis protein CapA/YwtB (metallophosphatase superfamily)
MLRTAAVREDVVDRPQCDISLFLAGDAIITQPWSHVTDPDFVRLVAEIRAADVAITNLETVIHEFKGYAQAESGGIHMASPPLVASELKWAGIDMVADANNHAFDYGSIGVLENLENVSKAGLVLAGSGRDLQEARAPRYMQVGNRKVALVSVASTFVSFGKASHSRSDMRGRPGINPLSRPSKTVITITRGLADLLGQISRLIGYQGERFIWSSFELFGVEFRVGETYDIEIGPRFLEKDLEGNLAAIRSAAKAADVVVLSLHAHHKMDGWLRSFAHQAINEGADVVFIQGPHHILGIELYDGHPIFYGMGDFVLQLEQIERLPAEFYEGLRLSDDATLEEARSVRAEGGTDPYPPERWAWESYGSTLCFVDGRVAQIRLLPLDLGFGQPLPNRGWPRYADARLGRSIMDEVQMRSSDLGTKIWFSPKENAGYVDLSRAPSDLPR